MKTAAKVLADILTALIGALAVIYAIGFLLMPAIGYTPYIVESGSMEPAVPTYSVAYINTKDTDIEPDDIFAFRLSNGQMVMHRCVGIENGMLVTKGDANENNDFVAASPDDVTGTYAFHIPYIGKILGSQAGQKVRIYEALTAGAALVILFILADDEDDKKQLKNKGGKKETAAER